MPPTHMLAHHRVRKRGDRQSPRHAKIPAVGDNLVVAPFVVQAAKVCPCFITLHFC